MRRGTVAGSQQVGRQASRQEGRQAHTVRLFASRRREIRQHRQLVHFLSGGELQAVHSASPSSCTCTVGACGQHVHICVYVYARVYRSTLKPRLHRHWDRGEPIADPGVPALQQTLTPRAPTRRNAQLSL